MAKVKPLAGPDRHWLRHVRQVPAGTPGAYQDPILGCWWLTSRDGLNFVQAQGSRTLSDESELDVTVPPVDAAGRSAGDRYCLFAGSADITPGAAAGAIVPYHPGDEWFELYRGRGTLVQNGTPYDAQATVPQVAFNCGDALRLLRKARETAAGVWCHAPRDVFEHYSRLWQTVLADDFTNSAAQFTSGTGTTPDGRWQYVNAQGGGVSYVSLYGNSRITSTASWADAGASDHSCWRAEMVIATWQSVSGNVPTFCLQATVAGSPVVNLQLSPSGGIGISTTDLLSSVTQSWPVDSSALFGASGSAALSPPYTLAIEARDRWLFFYIDGQYVGNAPRPGLPGGTTLNVTCAALGITTSDQVLIDQAVVRKTTPPLNGADPGDYWLPSPPDPGGLAGEYFDTDSFQAQFGMLSPLFGSPLVNAFRSGERVDLTLAFGESHVAPTWSLGADPANPPASFAARWTGAIYLPLDLQDVHFQLPSHAGSTHGAQDDEARLWVGRTRAGEQILTSWTGDTRVATSVGMRSLFGTKPGWYPLVYEYHYGVPVGITFDPTNNPAFTWDVGAAGTIPDAGSLAPLGVLRQQIRGDSHYDTLKSTIADSYAYQFTCEPRKLESGQFPGAIIPRARVGRDTELILDDSIGIDPQPTIVGEDVADALIADAQGLGGLSSGSLTLEAFNFDGMQAHPFLSSEQEQLPSTTVYGEALTHLLSLLGYRSALWEQLQSTVAPIRQKADTFPLTGALAEFDWAPGDGLRVRLPAVFINDITPRQLYTVQRTYTPDGVSDAQATFQPRIRTSVEALRKFVRQVYGQMRTFQGQLVTSESQHVEAPTEALVVLPIDITNIRRAELVVTTSSGYGGSIVVNGVNTLIPVGAPGYYNITQQVARNNGEPRMRVNLTAPGAGTSVSYCVRLTVLLRSS